MPKRTRLGIGEFTAGTSFWPGGGRAARALLRRPYRRAVSGLLSRKRPKQAQSRNPTSSWLRLGCWSLRTALASIWRIRSRVTLKMCPTSSRV